MKKKNDDIMATEAKKQEPSNPNNWLYRDFTENDRCFSKLVYLGINDTEWPECTDEEKQIWEEAHPQPEPEETTPAQ